MTNPEMMTWADTDARQERVDLLAENAALRRTVERLRRMEAAACRMEDQLARIQAICRDAPAKQTPLEAVAHTIGRFQARIEALEGRLAVAERQLWPAREAP